MVRFLRLFFSKSFPAVAWTIIIFILLSLPGNLLPNENNLSISNLDKYVHITLFGGFVFLWSFYYAHRSPENRQRQFPYLKIFFISCLYGTVMEFVQKYFIPNRDFDLYDILADIIGALGGYLIVRLTITRGAWNEKNKKNRI
jgi:VanZ family protein